VTFLERSQRDDGGFVPLWFGHQRETSEENPVYGTSRVIKGLRGVRGAEAARARQIIDRAERFLLKSQNQDGGWGAASGVVSSIEETAVALGALTTPDASPAVTAAWSAGAEFLVKQTDHLRTFPAAPIGLYFAKLWYSEALYPLIFTTAALERFPAR
jgi:squalene-hopene/tetraprenyl-beta-curcumene cyclase